MSENLRKHMSKLQTISQVKSASLRKALMKEFSSDESFCRAMREVVKNTIKKNVPLTESQKKVLRKCKRPLLGIMKYQKKNRRKFVEQTGSGVFLPIVIPLVAELIGSLINNATH